MPILLLAYASFYCGYVPLKSTFTSITPYSLTFIDSSTMKSVFSFTYQLVKVFFAMLILCAGWSLQAQDYKLYKPSANDIAAAPDWVQLMYAEEAEVNVFEVDDAYNAYYREHRFEKSFHTQYYKRWRRNVDQFVQGDGTILRPDPEEEYRTRKDFEADFVAQTSSYRDGDWSVLGPIRVYNTDANLVSVQANVYAIDQLGDRMYCGTETSDVYRSDDGGETWTNMTVTDPLSGGVRAVEIDPSNADIVFISSGQHVYRSTDGGMTWISVLFEGGLRPNEILVHPDNTEHVFAACEGGFMQSFDGGDTWSELFPEKCFDIQVNAFDGNKVYLLRHNNEHDFCEFWLSEDGGISFALQSDGWFDGATYEDSYDGGARLAASPADPDRIYAYLIGEAKVDDNGYIGLYRSDDGGYSWTLPNGPAGGPYDEDHANLAIGYPAWQYHQGFYNCALMASPDDPDQILLGGLNLYKSDNGGETFYPLAGYVGGDYNIHVDMQDFRQIGNTSWLTTDGGIYKSEDFFQTDGYEVKMNGIYSTDFWGFGTGWNEDVMIGGCYHNGNISFYENYDEGDFLQLGGGEPSSGYVNQGNNLLVYSSDIGGRFMPENIGDPVQWHGFGISAPNESYWAVESTEMEFDPRCYSIAYMGKDNGIWRSDDMGSTFSLIYEFGDEPTSYVTYIEHAWSAPGTIYVCQQLSGVNEGLLWRTTDYGDTWESVNLPPTVTNSKRMLIQVDPLDENNIWVAFHDSGNGQKIFKSDNGGLGWDNWTTETLNGEQMRSIVHIGGTDGGLYCATQRGIFYRNNSMEDWEAYYDGLPAEMSTNIMRPFYRDGKLRLATYGSGIWESPLFESQTEPVAQIMVDQLETTIYCEADTFHFVDHSMLNHEGASWQWTFQGGTPGTADTWNADVMYDEPGTYLVTLDVSDGNGNTAQDFLYITVHASEAQSTLAEGFEGSFPPTGFRVDNPDGEITWELETEVGAFGESTQSAKIRGFDYWPGGAEDDLIATVDLSNASTAMLHFDVAYIKYAVNYSDSLEVLIKTDCQAEPISLYFKGGDDVATGPDDSEFFIPIDQQWRTDSIDLSEYVGHESADLLFRFHSGWGQNMYLDNILFSTTSIVGTNEPLNDEGTELAIYPTLLNQGEALNFYSTSEGIVSIKLFDMKGRSVYYDRFTKKASRAISQLAPGAYIVVLEAEDKMLRQKLIVK